VNRLRRTLALTLSATAHESLLLANVGGRNRLHTAAIVLPGPIDSGRISKGTTRGPQRIHEPHVVQTSTPRLALRTLDNLHARDVRIENLHRHLHGDTGKLVTQQEGGVDPAQFDAQDNAVERVAVLECDPDNVTRLDTAGIPSVVEESLALALGIDLCQLRLGDTCDWVLAYGAGGGRRRVDLDRLGGCDKSLESAKRPKCVQTNCSAYHFGVDGDLVFVRGIVRAYWKGKGRAWDAESRKSR